jgi:hypothetical protein
MATAVWRDLSSSDPLAGLLPRRAITGGTDWDLRFEDGEYEVKGYLGGSYVGGSNAAIGDLQQSSAHYYQRPDAGYIHVDSTRSSLSGYTAGLTFARQSGAHWLWSLSTSTESPGFDLNDAGQLNSADVIDANGRITYRETQPGELFHNYSLSARGGAGWDYGRTNTYSFLTLDWGTTLKNFMSTDLNVNLAGRALSDDQTRGGPLMGTPRNVLVAASLYSNFAAQTRWNISGSSWADELDGWGYSLDGSIAADIGDRLEVSVDPHFSHAVDAQQNVTTADNGRAETIGKRYIFAAIDRTTLSMQFRVNYAITPDLSLEVYAEPFVASGAYMRFGELASPGALHLRRYGTDGTAIGKVGNGDYVIFDGPDAYEFADPNFNATFFRSNLVLRWEWRPGSTIFLVWQQDRSAFGVRGEHVRPGDLWKSLSADGDHFLTLKASYWLPID